jgi:hypothetical protein
MNRILLLILIAGITFLIVLLISRIDLMKDIWLWLVGLAGPIVKIVDAVFTKVKSFFVNEYKELTPKKSSDSQENINEQ